MKIETDPTADPPFRPVIRLSITKLDELRRQLDQLLKADFIKPSTSPYGAPILFVRKKDGTLRMCVDYRGLNKITRKNRHPLPHIDELLDRFHGARYFSKLDLLSGCHQQRIFEPHTHKTAFHCRYGHFEFNVVPFGLTNAPASFSNMIRVLDPVLDKWVVVYLDDLLIYSKTKAEHLQHLQSVLTLLRKNGLYAKLSKCSFMQDETEFLGHTITKDGIKTSAGLTKAIRDWPTPKSTKDVQQFLGLAQFYQHYVSHFAQIAFPLSSLLANNTPFSWTDEEQSAFLQLKRAICSAPVLRIFDPDLVTIVDTDASGFAIGAVLLQVDRHGNAHPIAFTSRKLQSAERNYPTHEQELLAVIHALRTWRYYLMAPSSLSTPTTPPSVTFPRSPSSPVDRLAGWSCFRNTTLTSSTSEELTTSYPTLSLDDRTTVTPTPWNCTTSVSRCPPISATNLYRTTATTLALDPSTRIVWKEKSPTDTRSRTVSSTSPGTRPPP